MKKKAPKSNDNLCAITIRMTTKEYDLIKQAAVLQRRSMANYSLLVLISTARNDVVTESRIKSNVD